ncbi:MAG: hypothetical protein KDD37_09130 [Bdellovibrionales bacterium]|nr:hypothetical protein [Bdellovibrionales bacterium]
MSLCVVKNAFGQTYTGPYASGMGGAGRAVLGALEAAYMNPAQLGYMSQNHIYGFLEDGEIRGQDERKIGVMGLDTTTSDLFPGAITYTDVSVKTSAGTVKTKNYEFSLGRREYDQLSFGITLKRQEWSEPGDSGADHDINLGITFVPIKELGLAFVTYNVLESGDERAPRKYALGTHYIWEPFMKVSFDLAYQELNSENSGMDVMGGVALPFGYVDLLFGFSSLATTNEEFFTTGFVWNGPRLSLAYSYQNGSKESVIHNIDFGVFF